MRTVKIVAEVGHGKVKLAMASALGLTLFDSKLRLRFLSEESTTKELITHFAKAYNDLVKEGDLIVWGSFTAENIGELPENPCDYVFLDIIDPDLREKLYAWAESVLGDAGTLVLVE